MPVRYVILLLVLGAMLLPLPVFAQDEEDLPDFDIPAQYNFYGIESQIRGYLYDLDLIAMEIPVAAPSRLQALVGAQQRLDTKCNIYTSSNQEAIAENDKLMDMVSQYQVYSAQIGDSIQHQIDLLANLAAFNEAERFIESRDSVYSRMLKEAMAYALTQYTADKLAALKNSEGLIRQELNSKFNAASGIAAENPVLRNRMQNMMNHYNNLTVMSDRIQAAEYKSPFDRIKDYLYGFAALSMILMFVNMILTKIKVAKQMREQAKKLSETLRQNNDEYPTI